MRKIGKAKADAYFRERTRLISIFLIIGGLVSFGVVLFAESFVGLTFNHFPFHYFMAAQGAVITFIILLFANAKISDGIDKKYGIDDSHNERISQGKVLNH